MTRIDFAFLTATGNLPEYTECHDTNKWLRYAEAYGSVFLFKTFFNVRSWRVEQNTFHISFSYLLITETAGDPQ